MAEIRIEYFEEAHTSGKNLYGKFISAHEDATTTTSGESDTMPANARTVTVYAVDADHYINIGGSDVDTAADRIRVPSGQTRDFEIPNSAKAGTIGYRSVA